MPLLFVAATLMCYSHTTRHGASIKTNLVYLASFVVPDDTQFGAIAQLGERLPCTQEVCGSIPHSSTTFLFWGRVVTRDTLSSLILLWVILKKRINEIRNKCTISVLVSGFNNRKVL